MFLTFIAIQQGGKTKPKLIMFASLTLPANINIDGGGRRVTSNLSRRQGIFSTLPKFLKKFPS